MTLSRKFLHRARIAVAALFGPMLALVIWGSLIRTLPDTLDLGFDHQDLVAHFGAYFLLGAMAATIFRSRLPVAGAVLGLIALGIALEIIQTYTGRDRSALDAIANSAGAVLGGLIGRSIVEPLHRSYDSSRH